MLFPNGNLVFKIIFDEAYFYFQGMFGDSQQTHHYHLVTTKVKSAIYFQGDLTILHEVQVTRDKNNNLMQDNLWTYTSPILVHEHQRSLNISIFGNRISSYTYFQTYQNYFKLTIDRTRVSTSNTDYLILLFGDDVVEFIDYKVIEIRIIFKVDGTI